jgi:hypothetical protein
MFESTLNRISDFISSDFMDGPGIWIIAILLAIPLSIYALLTHNRCPKCKKRAALESTGKEDNGSWYQNSEYELMCKYCGHCIWMKRGGGGD